LYSVYPLRQAAAALEEVSGRKGVGKVVIDLTR
jgi:hypothetical protein